MIDAASIAQALRNSLGEEDDERILARLSPSPNVQAALEELARDRDLEVRGWVPGAARELLGQAGVPLFKRLAEDRDPGIRGLALDALEAIDPKLLRSLETSLRKWLKSKDDGEVLSTAWMVAQADDKEAIPAIDEFRKRYDPSWWQHKAASVVLLAMRDPDEIPRRMRAHDHDHMMCTLPPGLTCPTPDRRSSIAKRTPLTRSVVRSAPIRWRITKRQAAPDRQKGIGGSSFPEGNLSYYPAA